MRSNARLVVATLLTLAVTAGVTLVAALPASSAIWAPRTTNSFDPQVDLDQFEARILVKVNQVRVRRDLPRVRVFQSCVDGYAESWVKRLSRTGTMQHRDLTKVINGCNLNWVGENLVSGTGLRPATAVRAWMNSPPHRSILLKKRARWAGIGVRVGSDGRTYAVLNFGDHS